MRGSLLLSACLFGSLIQPVLAQDLLQSFGRMVEELVEPDAPPGPSLSPEEPDEAEPQADPPPVPRPRPQIEAEKEEPATAAPAAIDVPESADQAPVPRPRPEDDPENGPAPAGEPSEKASSQARVYQAACPALLLGQIEAEPQPPIEEETCGERSPLSVTGVLANGRMVPLSSPATLNCAMASALPRWIETVDSYVRSRENTGVAEVSVGTSYACRPRNNAEGADVSEHGFANGLDVVGFTLEDGRAISVAEDWLPAQLPQGRLLRFAHGAACAGFTTVLGPQANEQHEDHFHLDLGCHGQSCTARICE